MRQCARGALPRREDDVEIRGKIKQLRHVGYFVEDMDSTLEMFRRLFDLQDADIRLMTAEETGGTGAFGFVRVGNTELELIQLASEAVREMCGDPPPGISHVAFQVEDIEGVVAAMQAKGFRLGYITRDGIFDNGRSKVAYLEPEDTDGHLIELVEPASD
jgi:catechol 2,3-dioxygenase-like lactoylglutathione lyase family enzyme